MRNCRERKKEIGRKPLVKKRTGYKLSFRRNLFGYLPKRFLLNDRDG
jgi:hypothetical protein